MKTAFPSFIIGFCVGAIALSLIAKNQRPETSPADEFAAILLEERAASKDARRAARLAELDPHFAELGDLLRSSGLTENEIARALERARANIEP